MKFVSSSTIYEDNNEAIFVATGPRMTPTSKHITVKYHWFRQHLGKEFLFGRSSQKTRKQIFSPKVYKVKFL